MLVFDFWEEVMDSEKEYVRYLSKDIAYLKELREEYQRNSEEEIILSAIIHDECEIMDMAKERWKYARRAQKSEGIFRVGPSDLQPRDANYFGSGNTFVSKSVVRDADA